MDSEDKSPFGYDAFRRSCPSHTVLEMLASKWVYLTVCALRRGRLRNGELARKLEGITPKMLTQTLRVLERDGLVRREVFAVIPPRVEYELTELGQNLAGLLSQIRSWAEEHAPEIKDARARALADHGEMGAVPGRQRGRLPPIAGSEDAGRSPA